MKARTRKPPVPTEAQIQRGILDTCAVRKVYALRLNSGAQAIPAVNGQARRFVRFGEKGAADIMAIVWGRALFVEVKRPGKRLDPEQLAWLLARQRDGAVAIWCDRVENFDTMLVHLLNGGNAVLGEDGSVTLE